MSKEELNGKDVEDINASIIVINKKLSNDHSRSINWEFLLECFKPGVEEDEEAWLVRVKSRVARILVDLSSKSTSVGEIVDKHNAALVLTALLRGYIQVAKKNSDSPERTSLHQIFAKHQQSQTVFRPKGRKKVVMRLLLLLSESPIFDLHLDLDQLILSQNGNKMIMIMSLDQGSTP